MCYLRPIHLSFLIDMHFYLEISKTISERANIFIHLQRNIKYEGWMKSVMCTHIN